MLREVFLLDYETGVSSSHNHNWALPAYTTAICVMKDSSGLKATFLEESCYSYSVRLLIVHYLIGPRD